MIDLKDLHLVRTVAEAGSLNAAAAVLSISQPALTKKVRQIEEALGFVLFDRLPRGMRLTVSGRFYLTEGEALTTHARDVETRLAAHREGRRGEMAVGVVPGLQELFFREAMLAFAAENPDVAIRTRSSTTPALAGAVLSGDLDFAFVVRGYADHRGVDRTEHERLKFAPLAELPLRAVVRAGHPATGAPDPSRAVLHYPLACPEAPTDVLAAVSDVLAAVGSPFRAPSIVTDDYEMVLALIERSDYWTGMPLPDPGALARRDLVSLPGLEEIPPLRAGLLTRAGWSPAPAASEFLAAFRAAAGVSRVSR